MSDPDLDAELNEESAEAEKTEETSQDESEAKAETEEETPEPMMPVAAHVAERKELQKRVEFAEDVARRNHPSPPAQTPAVDPVDFLAEPEKIEALINTKIKQATEGLSKSYAVRQHGRQVVDKALKSLRAHGTSAEQQTLNASADPWGDAVDWHLKREVMAEIGGDPVAWKKAETERIKKELLAQAVVKQAKGTDPAPSLAASPNLGTRADTTEAPDESLEALLP